MWKPRPILGSWTPDQARVAGHFPAARRLCVTSGNGVGKTFVAADLAVSFLLDVKSAWVITTAPTNRQVNELLWPEVVRRLRATGLIEPDEEMPQRPIWRGEPGKEDEEDDQLVGFATNKEARMQGFHHPDMLILIDEASGMSRKLLQAVEGIAVGERNYVLAIGNPNEPEGAFYELSRQPSWDQEVISALTHPNIIERREVIPGATTYAALCDRLRGWCKESPVAISGETFEFEGKHYIPNDAFRIRYLGCFPRSASNQLIGPELIKRAVDKPMSSVGRRVAALDVARLGGDQTVYGLRCGDCVTRVHIVPPADLMTQADYVVRLLHEDGPEVLTCDAAGLGIGLIDRVRQIAPLAVEIRAFLGADPPISPLAAKRYFNMRAVAYGNLADAFKTERISIPHDAELEDDLARVTYRHTDDGRLQITPKERIKAETGKSPDRGDMLSMLWEQAGFGAWSPSRRPPRKEVETW